MSGSLCPTDAQIARIVEAVDDPIFRRFTLVAAWSGLRLFEVAALEAGDVEVRGGPARVRVRRGKGGRERVALLYAPGVGAWVEQASAAARRGAYFRTRQGRPFTRQLVASRFSAAAEAAGVEGVTFHGLRKRFGSRLLDQGVSELDVAVALGHFRRDGRPHVDLVRRVYGFPSVPAALERLEAVGA